eukprot:GDKI01037640.1.p1 GENE.GDKI01037640.1~~GDKI01037640.1.p1  ORF type:complete len:111 (-),score=26.74 GDKI01037640.1:68-400(-)
MQAAVLLTCTALHEHAAGLLHGCRGVARMDVFGTNCATEPRRTHCDTHTRMGCVVLRVCVCAAPCMCVGCEMLHMFLSASNAVVARAKAHACLFLSVVIVHAGIPDFVQW